MFSSLDENMLTIIKAILVGGAIFFTLVLVKKLLKWFFREFDMAIESKEKTAEVFLRSILNYLAIAGYLVYLITPHVNLSKVLMGAGIIAIILGATLQHFIKDAFIGFVRLYEKQFVVGDFVVVNGKYQGTVEEVRVRFVLIREWSGRLLMLAHSQIYEIQNYSKGELRVIETIVISYHENPEKAKKVVESVCKEVNTFFKHWLQVDLDGKPKQPFELFGVTSLNKDYQGIEFTVIGSVKAEHYFEACNAIRYELAKASYNEGLKLAERTVFFRSP